MGLNYIPDYTPLIRLYHADLVREVLNPETMVTADMINPDALMGKVDLFLRGYPNLLRLITNLMSIEIFLKEVEKMTGVKLDQELY